MCSAAADNYSLNKLVVVARMLSGRFRCGSLVWHFSPSETGICKLCKTETEDIEHILLPKCPPLLEKKQQLLQYARESLKFFEKAFSDTKLEKTIKFLLDPSVYPEVILGNQNDDRTFTLLLKITSTWCYSLYRVRAKLLENLV